MNNVIINKQAGLPQKVDFAGKLSYYGEDQGSYLFFLG